MSIVCPACGMRSHNPNDERERYCGNCHAFHDDLIAGRAPPGPIQPASETDAIKWGLRGPWFAYWKRFVAWHR